MLDKEIEQRINIKFLVKLKKTATKSLNLLREAYGETSYEELVCLNETRDLQKEVGM